MEGLNQALAEAPTRYLIVLGAIFLVLAVIASLTFDLNLPQISGKAAGQVQTERFLRYGLFVIGIGLLGLGIVLDPSLRGPSTPQAQARPTSGQVEEQITTGGSADPSRRDNLPQPENVLFEANWDTTLRDWNPASDWRVINGILVNDGSRTQSIIRAPWTPGPDEDYAIEAELRSVDCRGRNAGEGFGVVYAITPQNPGWFVNQCSDDLISISRSGEWLLHRTEIRGNLINQCKNGVPSSIVTGSTASLQTPHSQRRSFQGVGLVSYNERIEVRSYRVVIPQQGELCR
jgi:hypothetical protein